MGLCKISLSLLYILGSALIQSTHAQDTPQDFLNSHNSARAAVGVGPLIWEDNIARFAQNHANQRTGDCNLTHTYGQYGENLSTSTADLPGAEAVDRWVAEKVDYNYESNSCVDGKMCGHYRQVVWNTTVRVGCAKVRCNNGGTFIGCNYDPPGNYQDEKPY
ncbi:pathogenesis-related protein 1-like [Pyrus x bretschneideri]|uniref:pathogenesis-related protein 1-like n=1 Tax=Pyrus x bretschneideri TaxID=225117 RepID=UPI0020309725|nr:pathogenesis-related protein 1-like [Pyrus x bretschneideri]